MVYHFPVSFAHQQSGLWFRLSFRQPCPITEKQRILEDIGSLCVVPPENYTLSGDRLEDYVCVEVYTVSGVVGIIFAFDVIDTAVTRIDNVRVVNRLYQPSSTTAGRVYH
jgi:hypothetical protein